MNCSSWVVTWVQEVVADVQKLEVRIRYPSGLCAADCKRGMHGRPFDGRRLLARVELEAKDEDKEDEDDDGSDSDSDGSDAETAAN